MDIGLVSTALGLSLGNSLDRMNLSLINEGGLAEQFVGQSLRLLNPYYIEPELYYWTREQAGSSAETDYLIQYNSHIIPVEVKAGKTGQMRSLHLLMALRQWHIAVRINSDYPSLTSVEHKTALGETAKYRLLSLPFYLMGQLNRLIENSF